MKKDYLEIIENGLLLVDFSRLQIIISKLIREFRKQELIEVLEALNRRHTQIYAKNLILSEEERFEVEVIMSLVEIINEKTKEIPKEIT